VGPHVVLGAAGPEPDANHGQADERGGRTKTAEVHGARAVLAGSRWIAAERWVAHGSDIGPSAAPVSFDERFFRPGGSDGRPDRHLPRFARRFWGATHSVPTNRPSSGRSYAVH